SARRWRRARVLAVESNLRAVALLEENARQAGVSERVEVLAHDGLPGEMVGFKGEIDLALINPPTHADVGTLVRLLDLEEWLAPGGSVLVVVNRPGTVVGILKELGAVVRGGERDGYYVFEGRWSG
ncbi:MAG: methyltransferase, partial [Deltaproteobacteria bacterium]|nr:methyltransferase [Deltaproteobacteria bacterium]